MSGKEKATYEMMEKEIQLNAIKGIAYELDSSTTCNLYCRFSYFYCK
jgi:hypothetical protein